MTAMTRSRTLDEMDAALFRVRRSGLVIRNSTKADPLEPERHRCARVEISSNHSRDRGSTMNVTTYGLDLAKRVFQVHWVEADTGEIKRKVLARGDVGAFFARRVPGIVAMESCGSAHHWGRVISGLGHQVRLIAAQFVRPFVKTNKTDAADAEAIWEAAQRPGMRFVALKSEEQQAVLSLHRMRAQLVKIRAMQAYQVRSLLYEFGVVAPKGFRALKNKAGPVLADPTGCPVPELLRGELLSQLQGLESLTARIEALERRIGSWQRRNGDCERLAAIPGVGQLTATAAVATVSDARSFRSGREFAAFLGIVPRQSGTGGRVKLLGISKRGDPYLRTLLIHGARSVILTQSRADRVMDPWLRAVLARRPKNVAIVALANKMARTIWALLAHGRHFDPNWDRAAMSVAMD
jgi:transposase